MRSARYCSLAARARAPPLTFPGVRPPGPSLRVRSPRLPGSSRRRYRNADLPPAPAPLQQPAVQCPGAVDHPLQEPRPAAEMRGELAVDLERPPIGVLPLAIAAGELTLLLRAHRQQDAVAGGADLHMVFRSYPEAVPAAHVAQPSPRELKLLGSIAQGGDEGGDIEI